MKNRTIRFIFIYLALSVRAAVADDQPPFQLIGSDDSGSIKVARTTANFRYDLQLKTNVDAKGVSVTVSPFISPDSSETAVQWTVNGKPGANSAIDLTAGDSVIIEIAADLPMIGDYSTFIAAKSRDKPVWRKPLLVTRSRVVAPIEVSGIDMASCPEENVSFWFTLTENSGRKLMLFCPEVSSLAQVQTDKKNVQAADAKVTCTDANGGALGDNLELPEGKPVRLKIHIQNLSAGEYAGVLRISGSDLTPVDQKFGILVHKSALPAGLLIFTGVVISFLLRFYSSKLRPRLLRERRTQSLLAELDNISNQLSDPAPAESQVIRTLNQALNDLYQDLEIDTAREPDKLLDELATKLRILPLWLNDRAQVAVVQPRKLAQDFTDQLDQVQRVLLQQGATDDDLKKADDSARSLPIALETAIAKYFEGQLDEFEKQCTNSPDTVRARINSDVKPKLDKAQELLTVKKLDEARAAFNDGRHAYVAIVSGDLLARLGEQPPIGFDATSWKTLRDKIATELKLAQDATDAEEAVSDFNQAYADYLNGIADALTKTVQSRKAVLEASAIDEIKKNKAKQTIDLITAQLTKLAENVKANDWKQASGNYSEAIQQYNELARQLASSGVQMGAISRSSFEFVPGPVLPEMAATIEDISAIKYTVRPRPTPAELTIRLHWYDWVFQAIVLFIAVAVGLELLWAGNPIWGSWQDMLVAVLWGLGLHQVAGATLDPSKIAETFSK